MNLNSQLIVANRQEWREWPQKQHAEADEIWLVYYKKHTGKSSVSYTESLEEALCFGWIDGLKKGIDEEKYCHRFTPRKKQSKWSPRNILLARKLIAEGKMTAAGLAAFKRRRPCDDEFLEAKKAVEIPLTAEIENALMANRKAWDNFIRLAPGYRKQYAGWLMNAKRPETREKRLKEAIRLLANNQKLRMK